MKGFRKGLVAVTGAAALVAPVATATPAAANEDDCRFMGPSYIVQDAVDCVIFIYTRAIGS